MPSRIGLLGALIVLTLVVMAGPVSGSDPTPAPVVRNGDELRKVARARHLAAVAEAGTRALTALSYEQGPRSFAGFGVEAVMRRLIDAGRFPADLPLPASCSDLAIDGLRVRPVGTPLPMATPEPRVPGRLLRLALADPDPSLRWFALRDLGHRTDLSPVGTLLKVFAREPDPALRRLTLRLLAQDRYLAAFLPGTRLPERIAVAVASFVGSAATEADRLDATFLRLWYGGDSSPPPVETLFHMFERGYPPRWFERLFRSAPPALRRHFTTHLTQGYGTSFPLMLEVLSRFATDDSVVLHALGTALVNRGTGHFEQYRGLILATWERLSGMRFEGSDQPYVNWYHARRAALLAEGK